MAITSTCHACRRERKAEKSPAVRNAKRCRYMRWLWALARDSVANLVFYRMHGAYGKH